MKLAECNAKQRKAFLNIYHAANWIIGGLENTLLDYEEDSEEYKAAYDRLHDHEGLVNEIYEAAINDYYDDGCACYNDTAKRYLKDIRFCGKDWLMERCEARVKKCGY